MSAWSEAVWVVKKLQKSMNFSQQIITYTNNLNNLNQRVNDLNQNIGEKQQRIENLTNIIEEKNTAIMATKKINSNTPDTTKEPYDNAIWFILS